MRKLKMLLVLGHRLCSILSEGKCQSCILSFRRFLSSRKFDLPAASVAGDSTRAHTLPLKVKRKKQSDTSLFPEEVISYPPPSATSQFLSCDPKSLYIKHSSFTDIDDDVCLPDQYLYDSPTGIGVEDFGKFRLFGRDDLMQRLPEGLAGELSKDITMIPSSTSSVGIMLRKATFEILSQLKQMQFYTGILAKESKLSFFKSKDKYCIPKSGILLDGKRGVGKSCILNYIIASTREDGWLVIYEPKPSRYAREIGEIKRSNAGVYIQSEFSRDFLERMLAYNHSMLAEIAVDRRNYGCCSLDGNHRKFTERVYDDLVEKAIHTELRKIIKKKETEIDEHNEDEVDDDPDDTEHEEFMDDFEETAIFDEKLKLWESYRRAIRIPSIKDRLKNPMNLLEIAQFGIENEPYANQATYEIFEQLKKQTTYPLLIVIDEWNEVFHVSEYLSMRYENTKYNGHIPSYHLTVPRLFYKWDGNQYKRGMKIVATCWRRMNRRNYKPEYLGVRSEEIRTIRNFNQLEFSNYVSYFIRKKIIQEFPVDKLEYFYMLTGGNGFQSRRLLATLY